jgi:hypothetical protein
MVDVVASSRRRARNRRAEPPVPTFVSRAVNLRTQDSAQRRVVTRRFVD